MRKIGIWITAVCCVCAVAVFAWAQTKGKAGLWEVTTTRTMAGMPAPPPGAQIPPDVAARMGGGPMTSQVCVTQAMVDKYSGPPPQSRGNCQVTNMTTKPDGYSAEVTCTGRMAMKGTVDTTIIDSDHVKTKMHMTSAGGGPQGQGMDMTMESNAVYKGPDCGSVQPAPMPADK
jgi:hypothetical protein